MFENLQCYIQRVMAAVEIEDEECNGRSGKRGRRGDSKTGDWSCQRVEEEPHIHNTRNRPPNREETRLEGTLHLGSTLGNPYCVLIVSLWYIPLGKDEHLYCIYTSAGKHICPESLRFAISSHSYMATGQYTHHHSSLSGGNQHNSQCKSTTRCEYRSVFKSITNLSKITKIMNKSLEPSNPTPHFSLLDDSLMANNKIDWLNILLLIRYILPSS